MFTTTREKHPIYQLYVLLGDAGGMTSAQGVQLIKTVLPQFQSTVDEIISAGGEPDKLKEHMQRIESIYQAEDSGNAALNSQLRSDAGRNRDEAGRFAAQDQSEEADDDDSTEGQAGSNPGQGESKAGGPEGAMNDLLRRKASRAVAPAEGESFNTSLRRAAGRGSGLTD